MRCASVSCVHVRLTVERVSAGGGWGSVGYAVRVSALLWSFV